MRIIKPPLEPDNQRFWYEFLLCEMDVGDVYFASYRWGDLAEDHVKALPAAVLEVLVGIVAEEEGEYYANRDRYDYDEDDVFESTRNIVAKWADANLNTASDDEQEKFFGMIAGLDDKDKIIPCSTAMQWVRSAAEAGDLEKVKRIANACA